MIDLHTHTFHSDGTLIPSELVRRAEEAGYEALAITDHVDASNAKDVVQRTVEVCAALADVVKLRLVPGAEITHVPPPQIAELVERVREWGARVVLVHGETVAEPVAKGTNKAALTSRIDILAHPGLISEEEANLARERGICLELSARKGHCLANGHVAKMAFQTGAPLVLDTDAHDVGDLFSPNSWWQAALGAGLTRPEAETLRANAKTIVSRAMR
ncbi:MAG: histidinol phosphate phosphatase domain-containing protein [bacterium]|nr:histidinol phosphate phosphatase domain-containing protein [bacterium]